MPNVFFIYNLFYPLTDLPSKVLQLMDFFDSNIMGHHDVFLLFIIEFMEKEIDINLIKPYKNNPRNNDGAVEALANSIKTFGFINPIIVNQDYVILAGHTRLKALKKLNYKKAKIIQVSLSPTKEKAFRLADNKVGELAQWIPNLEQNELADIQDMINADENENFSMKDFGFDKDVDSALEDQVNDTDLSNKDFEKFQVVVNCTDEDDLQETYEKLTEEGYECDISTL